ncbi:MULTISPECIES: CotO family spore coat protein [unclassified Bacillus cereus group]|uniref:CotO family spore coat protein n=1 Tax=unclassified Bacillus cereus group TaxID=2750818 RepID=UPI001F55B4A7|nr:MULTISPECIES: CotO family spore coat protein [unclassified Bacillus cereus group]
MSKRKKERTPYPTLYITQPDFSEAKWNLQKTFVIKKEDENLRMEKIRREIAEAKRASEEKAMQVSNEKNTARNEENKNANLIVASEELAEVASMETEREETKTKEALEGQENIVTKVAEEENTKTSKRNEQEEGDPSESLKQSDPDYEGKAAEEASSLYEQEGDSPELLKQSELDHEGKAAEEVLSHYEQKESKQKELPQSMEIKNEGKEYEASKKLIKREEAEKEDTFHQMEKKREVNMYGGPPQVEEQVRKEREAEREVEQSEGIDRRQKRERSKSFKDMDNEEKILFLLDRPHYIASIRCQIKTKQDLFTGYVRAYEGGEVLLEVRRAQETFNRLMPREFKIPIDEIISIRMMAF